MISMLEFDGDSSDYIEKWLGDDSTPRKDFISNADIDRERIDA